MALTRTPEPGAQRLKPSDSVSQYRSQVLGGPGAGQPLPRAVLQSTVPKIPYSAKTGTGSRAVAMPTADSLGIFDIMKQRPGTTSARMPKGSYPGAKGKSVRLPSGGYAGPGYSAGDRSGVYGLTGKAGARLQALQGAYKSKFGQNLTVNSGGRSYADQVAAYNKYLRGGNLAAKPGTSVHEKGNAVDFGGAANSYSPQHTWLVQNAPKFGWTWAGKNFSQVEPWHFEYMGG